MPFFLFSNSNVYTLNWITLIPPLLCLILGSSQQSLANRNSMGVFSIASCWSTGSFRYTRALPVMGTSVSPYFASRSLKRLGNWMSVFCLSMETFMAKTIHCAHVTWPSKLRIDGMQLGRVLIGSEIAMCTCSLSSSMQIIYHTCHVTMYGTYVCIIEHMYACIWMYTKNILWPTGWIWANLATSAYLCLKKDEAKALVHMPYVSWSKVALQCSTWNGHSAVKKHPFMSIHKG